MSKAQSHGGLDRFRLIAALLIVAIHTSPLASYTPMGDFLLTRVIARVGVPFFLMISGYFLLPQFFSNKACDFKPLIGFLKKLVTLYGIATLIYLPVSIYAGYYENGSVAVTVIKNLFIDGTFYHLWYFPCTAFGVVLVCILARKLSMNTVMIISFILYIIGLFGDSYYGALSAVPAIKNIYDIGFSVFSYTRNGLFYAPIFLSMGSLIALAKRPISQTKSVVGFGFFMVLMLCEGTVLNNLSLQRHDSMYLTLLPCSFFLFHLLLSIKGKSKKSLRTLSMWVYIIHPLFIVLVRGFAKVVKLTPLLVENSLVHYLVVSFLSICFSIFVTILFGKKNKTSFDTGRAWIELDIKNLRHNYSEFKKLLPSDCQIMPAVKANAYGHGAVPIAKELNLLGTAAFCVATVAEAVELRKGGIVGEILILGYTHPQDFALVHKYFLTQTVVDASYAQLLNNFGKRLHVHIKIDTGMHRQGERCENIQEILQIFEHKNLVIDGIFTHMCVADSNIPSDIEFCNMQSKAFDKVLEQIKTSGYTLPKAHLHSSYGALAYPDNVKEYARVGIAIYGLLSTDVDTAECSILLLPVMSIKARISTVKTLLCGEGVGYGLQFTAPKNMQIAVVTIGYGDGLPRSLSCGIGSVLINGQQAPILGRVCMDQTIVDITSIQGVQSGDIAIIVGTSGDKEITVCDIARKAGTISNEILSHLSTRLARIPVNKK